MNRYALSLGALVYLLVSISTPWAATVTWQNTTKGGTPFIDKGPITTTAWDNDNGKIIVVDEKTTYQEIYGNGGCFNEKGWTVLKLLSQSQRDSVMKLLFDSVSGCNFSICRVPIGSNDYAWPFYSLDETSGDYTMDHFSIDRDKGCLVPYIKAAMAVKPSLKVWGSPWSVPTWMKDSKTFVSGKIVQSDQNFTALALYFAKAVKAYQQEGLHYFAVMPANEPTWSVSMGYPVTGWTAAQLRDFIKSYIGPRFRSDDVNAEIYLGTLLNNGDNAGSTTAAQTVYADSIAYSYCTGGGFQYSMPAEIYKNYADKRIMETETDCGTLSSGGINDANELWSYATHTGDLMCNYFQNGANVYSQWNMVLDVTGASYAEQNKWQQHAPIYIDTIAKKIILSPQYWLCRHYGYVKPGAVRISCNTNANVIITCFRNPDGENVLVAMNEAATDLTVAINFNGQKIKPTLPANSINSFRIAGTPIPPMDPFSKIEAEKFTRESGVLVRPNSDGGSGLTLIGNNDFVLYNRVDFGTGANKFEARVSGAGGGSIEVHIDSCNGPAAGTCAVAASGGWSTVSCPVTGVAGIRTLYLKFKGTATGNLFDLNWFDFSSGTSTLRTQRSAMEGNHPRIALYNGAAISRPGVMGKKPGAFSVYALSGKLVFRAPAGNAAMSGVVKTNLKKGVYIIENGVK
jgi:glucosylceramidase